MAADKWQVTGDTYNEKSFFFVKFFFGLIATIHTHWEIQCLPQVNSVYMVRCLFICHVLCVCPLCRQPEPGKLETSGGKSYY